jgi:transposase
MLTIDTNRMVVWLMNNIDDNSLKIQKVKEAMKKTNSKRMYQRYNVIYLHLKGYTNKDISGVVGLCQHTVGIYVKNYKLNGLEGLVLGKSTGAPKFLTDEQEKQLFEVITTKTPDQVEIPNRKNWDTNIACQWVKKTFGVEYTSRGMLDVLHRLNLSYTRPTYTLAKANPQKQEEFKQEFELLKKPS